MAPQRIERKLAAILAADVVGYSRLMGQGEEATLRRLQAYRAVIDALIGDHRGRIFGSAGDSVIAEFSSSVEAVRCAVAIQQALDRCNADLPEEDRMYLRIGVNLGDVMVEGDNLFGDAINVAARLEGLAAPGGICVSEDVRHHVRNALGLEFEDLGEKAVKNIAEPVRVYRVLTGTGPRRGAVRVTNPARAAGRPAAADSRSGGAAAEAPRILVVDDDPDVRDFLQDYLSEHGYAVFEADSAEAMRAFVAEQVPDVVLLDVGLPGEDGLSLARYVREHFEIGIIMISGAGEPVDRIVGLEVGADDYVSKPFDPRELRARLKSVLRRTQRPAPEQAGAAAPREAPAQRVAIGRCMLDLESHRLLGADGEEIPLTRLEFELLKVFAEHPNRPLSRDQLLNLTQNRDWDPYDRSIDIRVARLRRKIEADPDKPQTIKTVRGVGYIFIPDSS